MFQRRTPTNSPTNVAVAVASGSASGASGKATPKPGSSRRRRTAAPPSVSDLRAQWLGVFLLAVLFTAASLFWRNMERHSSVATTTSTTTTSSTTASQHTTPTYDCPAVDDASTTAVNFDPVRFQHHYLEEDAHTNDLHAFLKTFRTSPYDDWGISYTSMKAGMTKWKTQYLLPHVRTGDTIYESALGLGLNALMTLELLVEQGDGGPQALTLFGNEYLPSSTVRANAFWDALLSGSGDTNADTYLPVQLDVTKGRICTGDSTRLPFVPSNSFDLVYTGYIL